MFSPSSTETSDGRGRVSASELLDSLWELAMVIDVDGVVIGVNQSWRTFATLNGAVPVVGVGSNFVAQLQEAGDHGLADQFRELLAGRLKGLEVAQPCDSPIERRWVTLTATPLGRGGALVTYEPSTNRVLADLFARVGHARDPITGLPPLSSSVPIITDFLERVDRQAKRSLAAVVEIVGPSPLDPYARRGHQTAMMQAANRLARLASSRDLVVTGNENQILLVTPTEESENALAERVRTVLAHPFQIGPDVIELEPQVRVSRFDSVDSLHHLVGEDKLVTELLQRDVRRPVIGRRGLMPELVILMEGLGIGRANDAAQEFFGLDDGDLTANFLHVLAEPDEHEDVVRAMGALRCGAIDMYRARREMRSSTGRQRCWVWARSIPAPQGDLALITVWPLTSGMEPTTPLPMGLEMAVGTVDLTGLLSAIRVAGQLFQADDHSTLVGRPLSSLVHFDDARAVIRALDEVDGSGRTIKARVLHDRRGWVNAAISIFVTSAEQRGFVVAEQHAADGEAARLLADAQIGLQRISDGLVGFGSDTSTGLKEVSAETGQSMASRFSGMSVRQRDILRRLAAGERVPAIARSMYLSESTVRSHLSTAFRVFDVRSQSELVTTLRSLGGVVD